MGEDDNNNNKRMRGGGYREEKGDCLLNSCVWKDWFTVNFLKPHLVCDGFSRVE